MLPRCTSSAHTHTVLSRPWPSIAPCAGYALFGSATDGDVLKDLTARFVATLVPRALARAMVYGVALSYTLCLLANFVLKVRRTAAVWQDWPTGIGFRGMHRLRCLRCCGGGSSTAILLACRICFKCGASLPACLLACLPACLPTHAPSLGPALALLPLPCFLQVWAVRDALCELLLGVPAHNLSAGPFYGATLLLVAAAYAISVMVPSIYVSASAAMHARGSAVLPAQG